MAYTKHTWKNGETITADKMNNLEEGVSEVKKDAEQGAIAAGAAQEAAVKAAGAAEAAQGAADDAKTGLDTLAVDMQKVLDNKLGKNETAAAAKKLEKAIGLQVDLGFDGGIAFTDGSMDAKNIGVEGVLLMKNGGTGASGPAQALRNFGISATAAQLSYMDDVKGRVQAQLDNKLGKNETAAASQKLATPRAIQTDLGSGSAVSFDGSGNITPGVKGVLGIPNGGHGGKTPEEARKNLEITPKNIGAVALDDYRGPRSFEGNLVQAQSFDEQGIRVVSDIVLAQAGSGDPSTDNVRPISGRSSAQLVRCGKNLVDMSAIRVNTTNVVTEQIDADTLRLYTTADKTYAGVKLSPIMLRGGVTYTLSASVTDITAGNVRVCLRKEENNQIVSNTSITFAATGSKSISYTPNSDIEVYVSPMVTYSTATAGDATFADIQFEVGDAATPYERYKGETYALEFGETVYGGRLNWNAGTLTVQRAFLSFDGTENWKSVASGAAPYWYLVIGPRGFADLKSEICSHFTQTTINSTSTGIGCDVLNSGIADECRLCVRPGVSGVTDLESWKQYLAAQSAAGTPVQMSYELAEPYVLQFMPIQLPALAGLNTVYTNCDGGQVIFGVGDYHKHIASDILEPDWAYPGLTNGTTPGSVGGALRYRKMGAHVYIDGTVQISAGNDSAVLICNLPEEYRPKADAYRLAAAEGERIAKICVDTSGNMSLAWLLNIADGADYTSTAWVDCSLDYWTD